MEITNLDLFARPSNLRQAPIWSPEGNHCICVMMGMTVSSAVTLALLNMSNWHLPWLDSASPCCVVDFAQEIRITQ